MQLQQSALASGDVNAARKSLFYAHDQFFWHLERDKHVSFDRDDKMSKALLEGLFSVREFGRATKIGKVAMKMKRVYRAYLAAHALALVNRSESARSHGSDSDLSQPNAYVQRMRVSVHRIVSNSAWFSKRFLGNQTSVSLDCSMIQTEAIVSVLLSFELKSYAAFIQFLHSHIASPHCLFFRRTHSL